MSCEFEKEIQSRAEFMNQCYVIMGGKNWSKKRSWKWPHFHNNFICLQDWLENHKVSFFNIFQLWIFAPKCLRKEIFFCHFGVELEDSIFFLIFTISDFFAAVCISCFISLLLLIQWLAEIHTIHFEMEAQQKRDLAN